MFKTVFMPQCLSVYLVSYLFDDFVELFVVRVAVILLLLLLLCAALCE